MNTITAARIMIGCELQLPAIEDFEDWPILGSGTSAPLSSGANHLEMMCEQCDQKNDGDRNAYEIEQD
jgi:hypothetical protein